MAKKATGPGKFRLVLLGLVATTAAVAGDESAQAGYALLSRRCDDFGGRLTGSAANRDALDQLAAELRALVNDPSLPAFRRTPVETEKLFTAFGLERRRQAVGYWPFR